MEQHSVFAYVCRILLSLSLTLPSHLALAQTGSEGHSVARQWNEVLLEGIRKDLARPTIHARNLFHVSAAMYDAWAIVSHRGEPYFTGNNIGGYPIAFEGFTSTVSNTRSAAEAAVSYTAYRLLEFRYRNSPGYEQTLLQMNALMSRLGYDPTVRSQAYQTGDPAALGNYIAQQIINFGLQDGANELDNYANRYYSAMNEPLDLSNPDSVHLNDPNRWQPLAYTEAFVDQSGNIIGSGAIPFLSPDWGHCVPFALGDSQLTVHERDGQPYPVYLDPGAPPLLDTIASTDQNYQWGFSQVAIWSGQLDPNSGATVDISPATLGNIDPGAYPTSYQDYPAFYGNAPDQYPNRGHSLNPVTNTPYSTQVVPLGDYTRVLAEFWADGPDSETPPGHWFALLNYVSDHPLFRRQLGGTGDTVSALEWDVKAYFTLGGAMHDAAIASWSVKGYYDYVRPISAIRYMGSQGQSTEPALPNFSPAGLPLIPGQIELITAEDSLLRGDDNEYVGSVKLLAWRGHSYIQDATTDTAGVGWIRAETWWPYQRPSFVTPPFAGYVSGHSTFSRAAAEVLTRLTGSEFFPGGVGEFVAKRNNFLVFEKGPSQDVTLQWATYYDAADQCSLSRIWGGIHAPADDIPGRKMGAVIGQQSYAYANRFFAKEALVLAVADTAQQSTRVYPNPTSGLLHVRWPAGSQPPSLTILDITGREQSLIVERRRTDQITLNIAHLLPGIYFLSLPGTHQRFARIVKQ